MNPRLWDGGAYRRSAAGRQGAKSGGATGPFRLPATTLGERSAERREFRQGHGFLRREISCVRDQLSHANIMF